METTTLLQFNLSGDLLKVVAEKYNCRKDKADCHTYDKCKYIARKEHSEPPGFYLVGSAKPMPLSSGRWGAWRVGEARETQLKHRREHAVCFVHNAHG